MVSFGVSDTHSTCNLALVDRARYPGIHDGDRAVRYSIAAVVSDLPLP